MTVVLDTSAVAAVVFGEPDAAAYASAMQRAVGDLVVSAATTVELGIVVASRHGQEGIDDLRALLTTLKVRTVPVDDVLATAAVAAWRRFGKGRHPAGLNYGDCFSYATAKVSGGALLFKGDDFAQTDIPSAL